MAVRTRPAPQIVVDHLLKAPSNNYALQSIGRDKLAQSSVHLLRNLGSQRKIKIQETGSQNHQEKTNRVRDTILAPSHNPNKNIYSQCLEPYKHTNSLASHNIPWSLKRCMVAKIQLSKLIRYTIMIQNVVTEPSKYNGTKASI